MDDDALEDDELLKFNIGTAKDLVLEPDPKDKGAPEPDPDPPEITNPPYPPELPPPIVEPVDDLWTFESDDDEEAEGGGGGGGATAGWSVGCECCGVPLARILCTLLCDDWAALDDECDCEWYEECVEYECDG